MNLSSSLKEIYSMEPPPQDVEVMPARWKLTGKLSIIPDEWSQHCQLELEEVSCASHLLGQTQARHQSLASACKSRHLCKSHLYK